MQAIYNTTNTTNTSTVPQTPQFSMTDHQIVTDQAVLTRTDETQNKKLPALNLVRKKLPPLKTVATAPMVVDDDLGDESYSDTDGDTSSEDESYFVEINLACLDEDDNMEEHPCIFNFISKTNYQDHADESFDDLENYFVDSINVNYPGWTYANEWEEGEIYGETEPDTDLAVVVIEE